MVFDEFTRAIMAKIVEKCGTREYWDTWAKDIAKIAQTHIIRITTIVAQAGPERTSFLAFLNELRDDLNPEIFEAEAVEMLAQHLTTKPVFDALFKDSQFTKQNPVFRAMEIVLGQLHEHNLAKESDSLAKFYASVERRAEGIKTAQSRQTLITELYDKFFRTAFPVLSARLGIVYTPVEVVYFIIHSVNDVLKSQFGQTLGSKGVHILDPFTGTGTFIKFTPDSAKHCIGAERDERPLTHLERKAWSENMGHENDQSPSAIMGNCPMTGVLKCWRTSARLYVARLLKCPTRRKSR